MKKGKKIRQLFYVTITTFLLCSGMLFYNNALCAKCNDIVETTSNVEVAGAQTVKAVIDLTAGELNLSGGANALMEAEFISNLNNPEPEVNYVVSGTAGVLTVEQPITNNRRRIPFRKRCFNHVNEWDIGLNNNIPIDVDLKTDFGNLDVNLDGSSISNFILDISAGDAVLNLTNTQSLDKIDVKHDFGSFDANLTGSSIADFKLDQSSGDIILNLTNTQSLDKVDVKHDFGSLDANLNNSNISDLHLDSSAGDAILDLSNTQSLDTIDLRHDFGDLNINLTGDRSTDLNANIDLSTGDIFLKLPTDIGVQVKLPDSISVTVMHEMNENNDNTITNNAFGSSNVSIFVDIDLDFGEVTLDLD